MNRERTIRALVVVGLVALLEVLCRAGVIPVSVLLPPSQMAVELARLLSSGDLNPAIASTFGNVLTASVLATLIGFVSGLALRAAPAARATIEPMLASYYAVPTFIFYPIFIVVFGVGNASIVAIAVLLSVVAMISATLNGLDRIPQVIRKTGRTLHMSRLSTAVLLELPAAAPYLFTGTKLVIAYAFIGVIASEFILSGSGLGYEIAYAYNNFDNKKMYAAMLLVLVTVTLVNSALNAVDRRLQARSRR
jgi:NitT/TauT family transport system permease protein